MARFESTPVRLSLALLWLAMPLGCGAAEPSGSGAQTPVANSAAASAKPVGPPAPKAPTARDRLQGKWEIVRYQSDKLIPDEAMPLMGALFNALRLEFSGTTAIARIEGSAVEERARFDAGSEKGDEFTLLVPGFMFDGARCRFNAAGEVEIKDVGDKWAGLSTLRRVR